MEWGPYSDTDSKSNPLTEEGKPNPLYDRSYEGLEVVRDTSSLGRRAIKSIVAKTEAPQDDTAMNQRLNEVIHQKGAV